MSWWAGLAGQTSNYSGSGKSFTLKAPSTVTSGNVTASVVEKSSPIGAITPERRRKRVFSLAYQARYDTAATFGSSSLAHGATMQGPGAQNWNIAQWRP